MLVNLTTRASRLTQVLLFTVLSGCASLPRIVILNDPLKAQEHADLASIYEEKGEYDLAIREGEEAIKMDSRNMKALIAVGNSHLQKGSYDKAERFYKKAMKIEPKNGTLLNNTAMLYLFTGRLEEAERLAREAISTNSPHVGYYYDTLGKVYEKMGKDKEAQEAFEKAGDMITPFSLP